MIALGVAALLLASSPLSASADLSSQQMKFRECVAAQESRGHYTVWNTSANTSAMGRYMFLDNKWRHGLAHMVADSLRDNGMDWETAKTIRTNLRKTPIKNWEPIYQDIGFATVLNARGQWSGWTHWYLPGSRCNAIVP
jgi:hypothetical protein